MNDRKDLRVRVVRRGEEDGRGDVADLTPGERMGLMWQLACDAWAFKGGEHAESRLRDMLSACMDENVEFLIVGAYALSAHGVPRADLVRPDLVFQIGIEPTRIDILTSIDDVAFDEAWPAREIARIDGLEVPVLALEHLIRKKRAVGRPRDLADLAALEERRGG